MIWFVFALSLALAEDDDGNDQTLPVAAPAKSAVVEDVTKKGLPPDRTSEATAKRYRKECEDDGISQSCFRYGLYLQQRPDEKSQSEGNNFVRRACHMAYTPACGRRATASVETTVSAQPETNLLDLCKNPSLFETNLQPHSDSKAEGLKVEDNKHPLLANANLQVGDLLTEVNGLPLSSRFQLRDILDKGPNAVATVKYLRGGKSLSTSIKCAK